MVRSFIILTVTFLSAGVLLSEISSEESSPAFRVVKATLRATPATYSGPCPAEIQFKAKISVTGGKGTVVFNIASSDGSPAPSVRFVFDKPGMKDTLYSWRCHESFMGWQQLVILEPNKIKSNQAEVAIMCQ